VRIGLVFASAFLFAHQAEANPLDDCTLQNMAGVTSDAAAKFVRQACLGKISTAIPLENLNITGTAAIDRRQYENGNALYLRLSNKSQYAITELMIHMTFKNGKVSNDYRVTNFLHIYTGPGIPTGLPPDPASYLQIPPFSQVYFAVPITQETPDKNNKWTWGILGAKGYLATDAAVEDILGDLFRESEPAASSDASTPSGAPKPGADIDEILRGYGVKRPKPTPSPVPAPD
jgi:hypothetical protein